MKIGDIVKCKKAVGSTFLRGWKQYKLVNQNQHGNWQVRDEETGETSSHWYKPERFGVIQTSSSKPEIDLSQKYRTRDGRIVKLIGRSPCDKKPIVGSIQDSNGSWTTHAWNKYGEFSDGIGSSNYDLFARATMKKIKLAEGQKATVFDDGSVYFDSVVQTLTIEDMHLLNQALQEVAD